MTTKPLIMIVDDEPANCKLLEVILAEDYITITCTSGQECLDQLVHHSAEIILLDVMMPNLNGYEVCKRLKENDETSHIQVIFISASDTLDDKLNGYNAGGDDYLGKPVNLSILLKKIELMLKNKKIKQQLISDVEYMQSGFMNALSMGEEFGQVTHFIEQCLTAPNYVQLFYTFFTCMKDFDLHTAAQIRNQDEIITLNSEGESLPLEKELMLKAQFDDHILEFGSKIFISYPHFSVLVKNLPIDTPDRIERLKEHLRAIAKTCDFRVKAIKAEHHLQSHKDIAELFKEAALSLQDINQQLQEQANSFIFTTQEMQKEVEGMLNSFPLKKQQKEDVMAVIKQSSEKCNTLNLLLNEHNTHYALHHIAKKMNKVIDK